MTNGSREVTSLPPFASLDRQRCLKRKEAEDLRVQNIELLFGQMGESKRFILVHLLLFLHKFSEFEAITKMGVNNLAVVFTPLLCYPPPGLENDIKMLKTNKIVCDLIRFLIQNSEQLSDQYQIHPLDFSSADFSLQRE